MKKALIVFLLLAMVAGGLFAEITFGGSASTGWAVVIDDDVTFHVYNGDHNDPTHYGFGLSATYSTESGKFGASGSLSRNSGGPSIGGNLWFKPLDILTVFAGNLGFWGKFSPPNAGNLKNDVGVGAVFQLSPISGLDILAGVFPFGASNANAEAGFADARYGAAVKYGSDLFSAGVNFRYNGDYRKDAIDLAAGVDVSALSNLGISSIAVGVTAENVDRLKDDGAVTVSPSVDFGFGAFSGGVGADLFFPVADSDPEAIDVDVSVSGSYPVLDGVKASLGAYFALKSDFDAGNGSPFDARVWNVGNGLSADTTSALGVRPGVSINLGFGTIDLGWSLFTLLGGESKTKNQIDVKYSVSF